MTKTTTVRTKILQIFHRCWCLLSNFIYFIFIYENDLNWIYKEWQRLSCCVFESIWVQSSKSWLTALVSFALIAEMEMKLRIYLYPKLLLILFALWVCNGQEETVCRASQGSEECSVSASDETARRHVQTEAVCFVVRTYWGHGDDHGGELRQLLLSLQAQRVKRFVVWLMMQKWHILFHQQSTYIKWGMLLQLGGDPCCCR